MKGKCSLADCGVKDGLACELGHSHLSKCTHFEAIGDEATQQVVGSLADDDLGQRLPWSGRAFGLSDMMLVSARSPARLVGLIGPFNSGKTTFLTSLFVHFAKTGLVGDYAFAGSYTIDAWARLKQYTEWPSAHGPSFPPHTPDTGVRVPSLLHLACREAMGPIRDLLFTDAPGEWFARWVRKYDAEDACGARWISEHATHFIFFVDRAALAGPQVGKARQDTLAMARLLSEHRHDRPVLTIWSKSHGKYDEKIEKPIREKLEQFFGPHLSWNLDAENPACLEVLGELLSVSKSVAVQGYPDGLRSPSAFVSFK